MEVPDSTIQFGNFVHKMDFEEIQNPKFNSNIWLTQILQSAALASTGPNLRIGY
jgi:hypothetical protein